jgi:aryl-alcohol dehydrogenase-like predicted oxidoreductase
MELRRLGRSTLELSAIGLGGLHFGVFLDESATRRLVHQALDDGVNFIDTAPPYGRGDSERLIGRAIGGRRERVILSTKVGLSAAAAADGSFRNRLDRLSAATLRRSVERSLSELGTDVVDLLQLHYFDHETPLDETLEGLAQLIGEGKIRCFGCSNHDPLQLQEVTAAARRVGCDPPVSSQVELNLIARRAEREMAPLCHQLELGLICNRALARGVLGGRYLPDMPPPGGSRAESSPRLRRSLDRATLEMVAKLDGFARDRGHEAAELAIAWLVGRPAVTTVLVGARSPDQLGGCLRGSRWQLDDDEQAEVERIIAGHGLLEEVADRPESYFER